MKDLTLVTGATGFIGQHVVRRLVAEGGAVRVFVRRPERVEAAVRPCIEIARGDIRDFGTVARAVAGAHTVVHLAGCARAWSRDAHEFTDVNVRGVEYVLQAVRAAGVERLIHVSTILTQPPCRHAPLRGPSALPTPYETSKLAGEQLVASYAAQGHHATIVHPTRVYGPGPLNDANALSRIIALYLAGWFRVRIEDGDVESNYVFVDDVAAGIQLAARRGGAGAHYLLGGENASFRRFLDMVAAVSGVRRRVIALPSRVAVATARVAELWGRVTGAALITPAWVRVLLEDRRASIEATQRELGYEPRSLQDGLRETIGWLASEPRRAA